MRSVPAVDAGAEAIGRPPTVSGLSVARPQPPLPSVPLEGTRLPAAAPVGRAGASSDDDVESRSGSAWVRTADAGLAIGAGATRAGLATAGAATTAGRSIANWFGRAGSRTADRF